jgi:hypothetical protein
MKNSHCTHPGGPAYCKSETCPGRSRYLEFKKTSRPATADITEVESEDGLSIYNLVLVPEDVENEIDETLNYAGEIEFANHGDSKHEYLTLQDLIQKPKLMRGNCLPLTEAIIENSQLGDEYEVSVAEIQYNRGMHAAVSVKSNQDDLVLDFTMRQFDADAPFPYVGKREDWEKKIDTYVEIIWLDQRKD